MFETPSKSDVAATTSIEDGYWICFFFKNSMIFMNLHENLSKMVQAEMLIW